MDENNFTIDDIKLGKTLWFTNSARVEGDIDIYDMFIVSLTVKGVRLLSFQKGTAEIPQVSQHEISFVEDDWTTTWYTGGYEHLNRCFFSREDAIRNVEEHNRCSALDAREQYEIARHEMEHMEARVLLPIREVTIETGLHRRHVSELEDVK